MPDPNKEKQLEAYNKTEIWVEAEGKRMNGYMVAFDRDSHKHRSCLYVPINKDLTIHLVVHAKGPCTSDLAFEIYFDGRPIHPVYVKRGNHHVLRVEHFFGRVGGEAIKTAFRVKEIPTTSDPMTYADLPSEENHGEIRIEVWKTKLQKGGQGSDAIIWRDFQAYVDEMPDNRLCICEGPDHLNPAPKPR